MVGLTSNLQLSSLRRIGKCWILACCRVGLLSCLVCCMAHQLFVLLLLTGIAVRASIQLLLLTARQLELATLAPDPFGVRFQPVDGAVWSITPASKPLVGDVWCYFLVTTWSVVKGPLCLVRRVGSLV
jgi:hypothetical protein